MNPSRFALFALLAVALSGCESREPIPVINTQTRAQHSIEIAEDGAPAPPPEAVELTLPDQKSPYVGFVSAAQPTTEQFLQLKPAGYTAVVNFRTEGEAGYRDDKDAATRSLLLYAHVPIAGAEDLTRENVEKFAKTLAQPMAKNGKVLAYCDSGNRVGAMVALKAAWVDGKSADEALELGKKAGLTKLEAAVKEKLAE